LKYVAQGGGLAEEAISTIRTAQAFGVQKILSELYDKSIEVSRVADSKASIYQGGGVGLIFFVVFILYALAFEFGTTLINDGHGQFQSSVLRLHD
jgi:ATP-binding cassette subfamily B (MDR/TAP) protein 1